MLVFQVIEDDKQWWKLRNRSGQSGYVPYNILDVVKLEDPQAMQDTFQVTLHTDTRTLPVIS